VISDVFTVDVTGARPRHGASTLKDDEDTKSKTTMVVSRVAEASGPRTWNPGPPTRLSR
jgi:hypothetical protein